MVPYFLLSLILGQPLSLSSLWRLVYGSDQTIDSVTSPHLWFLPCFFLSSITFQFINIIFKKSISRLALVVICGIISCLLDYKNSIVLHVGNISLCLTGHADESSATCYNIGFPFNFNIALTGVVLMYIGSMLRLLYNRYLILTNKKYLLLSIIVCLPLGYFTYRSNLSYVATNWIYPINAISWAVYGNYLLFLFTSVFLSVAYFNIAALVDNRYFAKWGKYTLAIYAFHPFILNILNRVAKSMNIDYLSVNGVIEIYSLLILFISIGLIPLIRKIDKHLIGE